MNNGMLLDKIIKNR